MRPIPTRTDGDGDGVGDACDNCVSDVNPGQEDRDDNGVGNICQCTPLTPATYDIGICHAAESAGYVSFLGCDARQLKKWSRRFVSLERKISKSRDVLTLKGDAVKAGKKLEAVLRPIGRWEFAVEKDAFRGKITDGCKTAIQGELARVGADVEGILDKPPFGP